jgi:hypothetical protein
LMTRPWTVMSQPTTSHNACPIPTTTHPPKPPIKSDPRPPYISHPHPAGPTKHRTFRAHSRPLPQGTPSHNAPYLTRSRSHCLSTAPIQPLHFADPICTFGSHPTPLRCKPSLPACFNAHETRLRCLHTCGGAICAVPRAEATWSLRLRDHTNSSTHHGHHDLHSYLPPTTPRSLHRHVLIYGVVPVTHLTLAIFRSATARFPAAHLHHSSPLLHTVGGDRAGA